MKKKHSAEWGLSQAQSTVYIHGGPLPKKSKNDLASQPSKNDYR